MIALKSHQLHLGNDLLDVVSITVQLTTRIVNVLIYIIQEYTFEYNSIDSQTYRY
jgi:hypothetical protein